VGEWGSGGVGNYFVPSPLFLLTLVRADLTHTSQYQQNILQNPPLLTFDFFSP